MRFIDNPTVGAVFTVGGKSWKWNGFSWDIVPAGPYAQETIVWRMVSANDTLIEADANDGIIFNSTSDLTLTIPQGLAGLFKIGMGTIVINRGTGKVTLVVASGVTLNKKSAQTLVMNGQNSQLSLMKSGVDIYELAGDMV